MAKDQSHSRGHQKKHECWALILPFGFTSGAIHLNPLLGDMFTKDGATQRTTSTWWQNTSNFLDGLLVTTHGALRLLTLGLLPRLYLCTTSVHWNHTNKDGGQKAWRISHIFCNFRTHNVCTHWSAQLA